MPRAAPATIAITVTGCTPGTAANSTRPAAAAAASVAITASSRVESVPPSNHATPATTSAHRPERVASAPSWTTSAATSSTASEHEPTHGRLPDVELDDAVRDLGRPRQIVRHDERSARRRLRPQEPRELGLALRIDAARRLVEHEQLRLGREHRCECEPLALAGREIARMAVEPAPRPTCARHGARATRRSRARPRRARAR